jgi:septum formation topological specificity factor MinE
MVVVTEMMVVVAETTATTKNLVSARIETTATNAALKKHRAKKLQQPILANVRNDALAVIAKIVSGNNLRLLKTKRSLKHRLFRKFLQPPLLLPTPPKSLVAKIKAHVAAVVAVVVVVANVARTRKTQRAPLRLKMHHPQPR